jgi:plasmid stability protein
MATLNIKSFPDSLYQQLGALAEREHRSIAQQVTHMLSQAVEGEAPLSLLDLRGVGKDVWQGTDAAALVTEERDSWDS